MRRNVPALTPTATARHARVRAAAAPPRHRAVDGLFGLTVLATIILSGLDQPVRTPVLTAFAIAGFAVGRASLRAATVRAVLRLVLDRAVRVGVPVLLAAGLVLVLPGTQGRLRGAVAGLWSAVGVGPGETSGVVAIAVAAPVLFGVVLAVCVRSVRWAGGVVLAVAVGVAVWAGGGAGALGAPGLGGVWGNVVAVSAGAAVGMLTGGGVRGRREMCGRHGVAVSPEAGGGMQEAAPVLPGGHGFEAGGAAGSPSHEREAALASALVVNASTSAHSQHHAHPGSEVAIAPAHATDTSTSLHPCGRHTPLGRHASCPHPSRPARAARAVVGILALTLLLALTALPAALPTAAPLLPLLAAPLLLWSLTPRRSALVAFFRFWPFSALGRIGYELALFVGPVAASLGATFPLIQRWAIVGLAIVVAYVLALVARQVVVQRLRRRL